MKIIELYNLLDKAIKDNENCKECDIEFWLHLVDDNVLCSLESIGQYGVIPDITIAVKPNNNKIYSSNELSEENLNYKKKYENLKNKIIRASNILYLGKDD